MNLKQKYFVLLMASTTVAMAQKNEWKDPGLNQVNRLEMHTAFFGYEDIDKAQAGNPAESKNYLSLKGNWKFNFAQTPDQRPSNFFAVGYDDKTYHNQFQS